MTFQHCSDDDPKLIFQTYPGRTGGTIYEELSVSWYLCRISVMFVSHFFSLVSSLLVWLFFSFFSFFCFSQDWHLTCSLFSFFSPPVNLFFIFLVISETSCNRFTRLPSCSGCDVTTVISFCTLGPPAITCAHTLFPTTLCSEVMVPVTASYCCWLNLK